MYKITVLKNNINVNQLHNEIGKLLHDYSLCHNESELIFRFNSITKNSQNILDEETQEVVNTIITYTKKVTEIQTVIDDNGIEKTVRVDSEIDVTEDMENILTLINDKILNHDSVNLPKLKQEKLNQFKILNGLSIEQGFDMDIQSVIAHFGMKIHDQINMMQVASLNQFPTIWTTDTHGSMILSAEEFGMLLQKAGEHKLACFAKYNPLKDAILNAESKEELDLIIWE